jgi:hypothetical protein
VRAGWWRTNRWWLPVLPVALVAMVVASSSNVREFWWETGLHHELASARPGEPVRVTDPYEDALGPTSRTFTVSLAGLEERPVFPYDDAAGERAPADGLRAVAARLDWEAEPDQVLELCQVSLLDSEGRRYDLLPDTDQAPACVPEGRGGPVTALSGTQERGTVPKGQDRPPTWSTEPVFLVPTDAEVTRVLVWWSPPDYAALSVS